MDAHLAVVMVCVTTSARVTTSVVVTFCCGLVLGSLASCSMIVGSGRRGRIRGPHELLREQADQIVGAVVLDALFLAPFVGRGVDRGEATDVCDGRILALEHVGSLASRHA